MKQIDFGNDLNVGNPTKENIEYAFKNLLFYVNSSACLDIYSNQKKAFEKVILKIKDILSIYINSGKLCIINEDVLQDIKFDLIDLDEETKILKFYYSEWALMWLEALMSLRISEIELGGVNNV